METVTDIGPCECCEPVCDSDVDGPPCFGNYPTVVALIPECYNFGQGPYSVELHPVDDHWEGSLEIPFSFPLPVGMFASCLTPDGPVLLEFRILGSIVNTHCIWSTLIPNTSLVEVLCNPYYALTLLGFNTPECAECIGSVVSIVPAGVASGSGGVLAVADPIISPPSGTYPSQFASTIGTSTPGVTIRFTTNNTEPTTNSPIYTGSIGVLGSSVIKARAYKDGYDPSNVVTATYVIGQAPPPAPTYDIELRGVGITSLNCAACSTLGATYLLPGVVLSQDDANIFVMDVPTGCGGGKYLRWLVDITPGLPVRVELRLAQFLTDGASEYILATYVGSSSSNSLAGRNEQIPLQATYYDPNGACNLAGSSVNLRTYLY